MSESIKKWAAAAAVRAVKTAAQTFIATIGSSAVLSEVNWAVVASATALAAILSVATSIVGIPEIDGGASVAKIAKGSDSV